MAQRVRIDITFSNGNKATIETWLITVRNFSFVWHNKQAAMQ
jgi:hypothetical protein